MLAGQIAGPIRDVRPGGQIVGAIVAEARRILRERSAKLLAGVQTSEAASGTPDDRMPADGGQLVGWSLTVTGNGAGPLPPRFFTERRASVQTSGKMRCPLTPAVLQQPTCRSMGVVKHMTRRPGEYRSS